MGFNKSSGSSSSKPLTPEQRSNLFSASLSGIKGAQIETPEYSQAQMQTLGGGDYDALQDSIYQGSTAGLDRFAADERGRIDQDLSDRGLYSSGAAVEAQGKFTDSIDDLYAQAGANAVSQRYGLQSQENAMLNQLGLQGAQQQFAAEWAPLDYLASLWSDTGGVTSSSKNKGMGISLL